MCLVCGRWMKNYWRWMKENSDSRELVNDLWKQTENIRRFRSSFLISFLKEISWRRILYSFFVIFVWETNRKHSRFALSLWSFFLEGKLVEKNSLFFLWFLYGIQTDTFVASLFLFDVSFLKETQIKKGKREKKGKNTIFVFTVENKGVSWISYLFFPFFPFSSKKRRF